MVRWTAVTARRREDHARVAAKELRQTVAADFLRQRMQAPGAPAPCIVCHHFSRMCIVSLPYQVLDMRTRQLKLFRVALSELDVPDDARPRPAAARPAGRFAEAKGTAPLPLRWYHDLPA